MVSQYVVTTKDATKIYCRKLMVSQHVITTKDATKIYCRKVMVSQYVLTTTTTTTTTKATKMCCRKLIVSQLPLKKSSIMAKFTAAGKPSSQNHEYLLRKTYHISWRYPVIRRLFVNNVNPFIPTVPYSGRWITGFLVCFSWVSFWRNPASWQQ